MRPTPARLAAAAFAIAALAPACDPVPERAGRDAARVSPAPRDGGSRDAPAPLGDAAAPDRGDTPAPPALPGVALPECVVPLRAESHLRPRVARESVGALVAAGTLVEVREVTAVTRGAAVLARVRTRPAGADGYVFLEASTLVACQRAQRRGAGLDALVREERVVEVDGELERWQLRWVRRPARVCDDGDRHWCGCGHLGVGERGRLELVRIRGGRVVDAYHDWPTPGEHDPGPAETWSDEASLPRWVEGDDAPQGAIPSAYLAGRPEVTLMRLADIDHDGRATEFALEAGYVVCGHYPSFVVGVSRHEPRLHVFRMADDPARAAWLDNTSRWHQVAAANPATVVTWRCGDHGFEGASEAVRVTAVGGRFRFVWGFFPTDEQCEPTGPFQIATQDGGVN